MKTEVICFRSDIQPSTQEEFKERVKDAGRVTEIRVRFYPGQERELQVRPYALLTGQRAEDFFTYPSGTDSYLSGDDDYLVFPVSLDLSMDDEIKVLATNNNASYAYTLVCDIVVQYYNFED